MSAKNPRFRISPGGISMWSVRWTDAFPVVEFFTDAFPSEVETTTFEERVLTQVQADAPTGRITPDLVLSFSTEEAAAILGAMGGDR